MASDILIVYYLIVIIWRTLIFVRLAKARRFGQIATKGECHPAKPGARSCFSHTIAANQAVKQAAETKSGRQSPKMSLYNHSVGQASGGCACG